MRTLLAMLCVFVGGCDRPKSHAVADDAAATPSKEATPAVVAPVSPFDTIAKATSLASALAVAKPIMADPFNDTDEGTKVLLSWSAKSMRWSDVGVSPDETSHAMVMKDADEERGKRLCAPGSIIEISVEKPAYGKVNMGLLRSEAGNLYQFYGVGSSGTLVSRSQARFCGVVTGRFDYENSGGGTGHAVKLVGMFDLPENRVTGSTTVQPNAAAQAAAPKVAAPSNVPRLKQCCTALGAEAKRIGDSPEAGMFSSAAAQCSALAAQAGAAGSAPESGAIRAMLAGRNVPAVCAGF